MKLSDHGQQILYPNWMIEKQDDVCVSQKMLFSDSVHFERSGYFNYQNLPHVTRKILMSDTQYAQKVTVRCPL